MSKEAGSLASAEACILVLNPAPCGSPAVDLWSLRRYQAL